MEDLLHRDANFVGENTLLGIIKSVYYTRNYQE